MASPFYFTPNDGVTAASGGIRYVDSSGIIHSPTVTGDAVFTANTPSGNCSGICLDASGNIYVCDFLGAAIYQISPSFVAVHILGRAGVFTQTNIPGPAASASLNCLSIALDGAGNIYLTGLPRQIFCINMQATTQTICNVSIPAGQIKVIAGTGATGFSGDGGQAILATMQAGGSSSASNQLALNPSGDVFLLDSSRIRKIDHATGIINTVVGTGAFGSSGDGGPATSATIFAPTGIACDSNGNVIWSQSNLIRAANFSGGPATIFGVSIANGNVDRISGQGSGSQGTEGYSGDGGLATAATLGYDNSLAIDPATGTLGMGCGQITPLANESRIRAITTAGIINTIAGNGTSGTTGDGGSALSAEIAMRIFGIAYLPSQPPSPPPPIIPIPIVTGGGGTGGGPGTGGVCTSTLNISPATELYQSFIPSSAMTLSASLTEGRTAAVIDFNAGDGLYSRDIETMFAWAISTRYAIRVWQPSVIPMPENQFNRPSDWIDGGTSSNKFIQGITVEADSFNLPKVFQLQSGDDLSLHALNEMPATFPKQTVKTFSCLTPFLAHNVRLFAVDGVAWRVWNNALIFEPWPSQVTNWQTEQTSFGMTGWLHARELNIAYASATAIMVVLVFDAWPTITLTLPSSGGPLVQAKTKVTLPANKFKLVSVRVFSTAPFYLFETDMEMKVKNWGSEGPFNVLKVIGGPSKPGAQV